MSEREKEEDEETNTEEFDEEEGSALGGRLDCLTELGPFSVRSGLGKWRW